MSETNPHRSKSFRWHFIVNPRWQGKLVAGVLASAVFSVLLLALDYYVFFGRNVPGSPWDPTMVGIFLKAQRPMVIQLIVFTTVLCGVVVVLSHRVAGPLVNLERVLRQVAQGDLSQRVRFRKGDELNELRDAVNAALESLHATVSRDRKTLLVAQHDIDVVLGHSTLDAEARAALTRIKDKLASLSGGFSL